MFEQKRAGFLRPLQQRRKTKIKCHTLRLQCLAGAPRFIDALRCQVGVAPAGKQVFFIPFALAMTDQDKTAHEALLYSSKN